MYYLLRLRNKLSTANSVLRHTTVRKQMTHIDPDTNRPMDYWRNQCKWLLEV